MKVVKVQSAKESHVNGATGSTGAIYAAVTEDGVEVARFRPARVQGYGRQPAWVRDASGRPLEGPRPCYRLAHFREWAQDGFAGAWVLLPRE